MLGRVFCAGCGTKLDLSAINEGEIEDMRKEGRWLSCWPFYLLGLLALILVVTGIAFWPIDGSVGDKPLRSGAGMVKSQLSAVRRIGKGQVLQPIFFEGQLNGYLVSYPVKKLHLQSFSVDIEGNVMKVRVAKSYGTYGPASFRKTIVLVMEVDYIADGNKLVAQNGVVGHLPMPGPLAQIAQKLMSVTLKNAEEWKSVKNIKEISIEDGRVKLRATR